MNSSDGEQKSNKLALKIKLLITVGIFFVVTVGLIFFREELQLVLQSIIDRFGLFGLFAITVVMDTVIQPISPDLLTLGYSMTSYNFITIALVGAAASILAGFIGFGIGHFLGEEGIDKFIGQKRYQKAHNLFVRHGFWAILIGSISPVPFSAICWSAGAFKMPFNFFCISVVITRLPRFILAGYIGTIF